MEKKRWLWKKKSSEKSSGETESSGSASSHSERDSNEQQEAWKESPNGSNRSPDVTSKAVVDAEYVNNSNEQSPEVTSIAVPTTDNAKDNSLENGDNPKNDTTDNINDGSLDETGNHAKDDINNVNKSDINDGLKNLSEKLSAALVNVSAKEDLVKQHAKVAEEAIAGWEKAENEVAVLKKQLEAATLRNSALDDRVTHLDGALKECVRQLRQTRDKHEQNISDAVVKKTYDLEISKLKLESQLSELQTKLEAANARPPPPVNLDMREKVEFLEKENMALQHELLQRSEELEIRIIERDLSTQAAETASKQHLESIKKVAKLEAECRRLKAMACRTSLVNDHKSTTASSYYVESLTDSQSDSGERLNSAEIDTHKMSGSEPNKCEPSYSDSWAYALIAELDQFKNDNSRQLVAPSVEIDLMDDFLEMERLAALPDTKNEGCQEPVVASECNNEDQSNNEESSLRVQFDILSQRMAELREKLEKVEEEKAELEMALMKSEDFIEASQLQLKEAEMKLQELHRELNTAIKSKQMIENELVSMEAEAQILSEKVDSLEAEIYKEKALSSEIAMKCKELEEEKEIKAQEFDKEKTLSAEFLMKCNELEEGLESRRQEIDNEKALSAEIVMKCKELEDELESKKQEIDNEKALSSEIVMKCRELEENLESKKQEIDKEKALSAEIAMKCKELREELESKKQEINKEKALSAEIAMKCNELEEEKLRSKANSHNQMKIKQEDLAAAAGKLAECQKTIASLGNQLNSLATLEDFLIDTASIPQFSASSSLIAQAGGEMWRLHSNDTYSPKRDSISSRIADGSCGPSAYKNEEMTPPSSSSSTALAALPNNVSSEKSRNGFAKFFSRTKSGIRLEI